MDFIEENRKHWDEVVAVHLASDFYDVEAFKNGTKDLHRVELEELAPFVDGADLLHLQCHFGLDTMAWARRGARVTGVDFSPVAIETANAIAQELSIDARFILSDIAGAKRIVDAEAFDIVFTSYGAIYWLPELETWAELIAHALRPGGRFYIAELHPTGLLFDDQNSDAFQLRYPYFAQPEPIAEAGPDYADPDATMQSASRYSWMHSLSDILNALTSVGLVIESFNEWPHSCSQQFPFLRREGMEWVIPPEMEQMPLLFSLTARKV